MLMQNKLNTKHKISFKDTSWPESRNRKHRCISWLVSGEEDGWLMATELRSFHLSQNFCKQTSREIVERRYLLPIHIKRILIGIVFRCI